MKLYKITTYPLEGRINHYYYGASNNGGNPRFLLSTVTEGALTVKITGPAVQDESEDTAAAIHTYLQLPVMEEIVSEEIPFLLRKMVKKADIVRIAKWSRADVTNSYFASLRMEALALYEASKPPVVHPPLAKYMPIVVLAFVAVLVVACHYDYI